MEKRSLSSANCTDKSSLRCRSSAFRPEASARHSSTSCFCSVSSKHRDHIYSGEVLFILILPPEGILPGSSGSSAISSRWWLSLLSLPAPKCKSCRDIPLKSSKQWSNSEFWTHGDGIIVLSVNKECNSTSEVSIFASPVGTESFCLQTLSNNLWFDRTISSILEEESIASLVVFAGADCSECMPPKHWEPTSCTSASGFTSSMSKAAPIVSEEPSVSRDPVSSHWTEACTREGFKKPRLQSRELKQSWAATLDWGTSSVYLSTVLSLKSSLLTISRPELPTSTGAQFCNSKTLS